MSEKMKEHADKAMKEMAESASVQNSLEDDVFEILKKIEACGNGKGVLARLARHWSRRELLQRDQHTRQSLLR